MSPKPPLQSKVLSFDRGYLWIEALVPGQSGRSDADPISFQLSAISEIAGFGPKNSYIMLNTGREILFDLSYDELRAKLRDSDDAMLDLNSVSRLATRDGLKNQFNDEARREAETLAQRRAGLSNNTVVESITFTVWARSPGKAGFNEFTFSGKDVNTEAIAEFDSIMGGRNISLHLKNPAGTPFTGGEFVIEMSLRQFRTLCDEAYMSLQTTLDLREVSLQKGTLLPPSKKAAPAPQP